LREAAETGPAPAAPREPQPTGPLAGIARAIAWVNIAIIALGSLALLAAALILTYSVASRSLFKAATDWQDEAAVFCIVGAVFLAAAYVQSYRGHIGIEFLATLLSPAANRVRAIVVDIATLVFCTFFGWKSWTLWHEAWKDNQTTTSSWSPPLWIPYSLMALGMTLLAVQVALQIAARLQHWDETR
jgi:TRAP-type C4-dicarboxylate transport system permease small subunit